jgi:hypothetical protein
MLMTCQGAFKKINFILYTKQTIKSKIKINRCTDVYRDIIIINIVIMMYYYIHVEK